MHPQACVDIATTGRHRGLSSVFIWHNYFHPSKLRRNFELQNTQLTLLKSRRDVMQLNHPISHNGLEPELADPAIIRWLTCRHEQTIDYVTVQTPSINYISE